MKFTGYWAIRGANKALARLEGSCVPAGQRVQGIERLMRIRVESYAVEYAKYSFARVNLLIISSPVWGAVLTLVLSSIAGASRVEAFGGAGATAGVAAFITFLYLLSARAPLAEAMEEQIKNAAVVPARELLMPFGGVESLPVSVLDDVRNTVPHGGTIEAEVAWWWSQLQENERQVLLAQGSTSTPLRDVLDAFRKCA
jgi:hypothetical protein